MPVATITYAGKTQNLREWAEEVGVHPATFSYRHLKLKWPLERLMNNKAGMSPRWEQEGVDRTSRHPNSQWITFRGEKRTLNGWSKHLGINFSTLQQRLNKLGWSVKKTFTYEDGRHKRSWNKLNNKQVRASLKEAHPLLTVGNDCNGMGKIATISCKGCKRKWKSSPTHARIWGCSVCSKSSYKLYTSRGNRKFLIQGFEDKAIRLLQREEGFKPTDIECYTGGKVPKIKYVFAGKKHNHFPDLYIPKQNRLIEVKSLFTLGLRNSKESCKFFLITRAKAKAAMDSGYVYDLYLMNTDGDRIKLPPRWYLQSRKELAKLVQNTVYSNRRPQ